MRRDLVTIFGYRVDDHCYQQRHGRDHELDRCVELEEVHSVVDRSDHRDTQQCSVGALLRGHYELEVEEPTTLRVAAAFTELAVAI